MTSDMSIVALLAGYIALDERGLPNKQYLAGRSEEDARVELVELLRSSEPLPQRVREALADLFEGIPSENNRNGRVLKFAFRKEGKRRDEYRDSEISDHVLQQLRTGSGVEAAVASAVEKFGISRAIVFGIWKRHKPIYVAMGWVDTD